MGLWSQRVALLARWLSAFTFPAHPRRDPQHPPVPVFSSQSPLPLISPRAFPVPAPLGFHPSTLSCSSPGRSSAATEGGSVPKGLQEPVLRWGLAAGLALAVCPAQTTLKRYYHRGHKLYLGKKPTKKLQEKRVCFIPSKKRKKAKKPFSWPAIS